MHTLTTGTSTQPCVAPHDAVYGIPRPYHLLFVPLMHAFISNMTDCSRLNWDMYYVWFVQLNCCGAVGPQDYLYSAWFNHTRDFTGVFVPQTCCQLTDHNPTRPEVKDENLCQVEAIVNRGETDRPITQLHTQVSQDHSMGSSVYYWRALFQLAYIIHRGEGWGDIWWRLSLNCSWSVNLQ